MPPLLVIAMHGENYTDLSIEAEARRLHKLVERLATEGFKPGESVPARILAMVDARRAGRLEFVRAA